MFVWDRGVLNEEQETAIAEPGNVFLVACPGSGKTRTLTYKIASELSKLISTKQWVVAITYTHTAADEIHERIENLGVDTSQLWIGTIHSFCLEWVLKPYAIYHVGLRDGFRVINSHDSERILTQLCRAYRGANITHWHCGHYFTSAGITFACPPNLRPHVQRILEQYHSVLRANRQIDFELILAFAYELIVDVPSIGKLLGSLITYVLVDEYQDTKQIQYAILAAILKAGQRHVRAFIVGDPNQCIFGSLGGHAIEAATFAQMADIEFSEFALVLNYRSSNRIIGYFGNYNVHATRIASAAVHRDYPSLISLNDVVDSGALDGELVRLIRYNIETLGVSPKEICVVAPWWIHLASMTRRLVAALPEYEFDGPGLVPFARDHDNFWYKLSKIVLTLASPQMFVRRLRWAADVIDALSSAGIDVSKLTRKALLRECNSIELVEPDGLCYLHAFFDTLFARLGIDFWAVPVLREHHEAFFESSQVRVERLQREGSPYIRDIATFRRVFENRSGITVSTIHGVKGEEYDVVIGYALLEGILPHFNDENPADSAKKLLYVLASRARKNLHLIAERGRPRGGDRGEHQTTEVLKACNFAYDDVP